MKTSYAIDIGKFKDYEETDLQEYQQLIAKLIYLAYGTRPNIAFVVG